MTGLLVGLLALVAVIAGVPLYALIAGCALIGLAIASIDIGVIAIEFNRLGSLPTLTALPLFTFAGLILASSRAPRRFLLLARALFGHFSGGVAVTAIVLSVCFTAFTSASGVTIIALGSLLLPTLIVTARFRGHRFPRRHAIGLLTAAGSPGLLLPPSLAVIVYAVTAEINVDDLFIATLLPAFLMILALSCYTNITRHRDQHAHVSFNRPFSVYRLIRAIQLSLWELPLPIIVVGGIYLGFITISEAATLTAFYTFLVVFVFRGELRIKQDLIPIAGELGVTVGAILLVVGAALSLTSVLVDAMLPQKILAAVTTHVTDPILFLLALNVFLLVAGMLVDVFSAIVLLVPLIVPIATTLKIDPLHLGVIFLVNLEVGYITPPVGINLFIARFQFRHSIVGVVRAVLPFTIVMIIILLLITCFPHLSLFLPTLFGKE